MAAKGTIKQKRVARRLIKAVQSNESITAGELVAEVGYSQEMQDNPGRVLNSPGVQDELNKMGFTEEKAREVVGRILADESIKPEPRLKAAEMVFKVHGTFAAEKHANLNVNVDVTENEEAMQLAAKLYGEAVMLKKTQ